MLKTLDDLKPEDTEDKSLTVRIIDNYYVSSNDEYVGKRVMRILKRQSHSDTTACFLDEIGCAGAEDIEITNFHDVDPGVYKLILIPGSPDWETGYVDEWSWRLVKKD